MGDGVTVGLLIILGVANPTIGLPLILLYLLLTATRYGPVLNTEDFGLFILIVLKIAWFSAIYFTYKTTPLYAFAQTVSVDAVLLVAMLVRRREGFFEGLAKPIFWLFFVDIAFNIWATVLGADPLGRVAEARPNDYLPRMGGVFFHPFYSINISLMAMLFAFYLRRPWLAAFAIGNVLFNGSYRGVLTLAVFFAASRYFVGDALKGGVKG